MRFLIFGGGAMGSLFAAALSKDHDVTLVGRKAHVDKIHQDGLVVRGKTEMVARVTAVETVDGLERLDPPDVVIVTVKSFDTAAATDALEIFWNTSLFISLQNGLGNAEAIAEKADKVLAGVTYNGVTFTGPGEIVHAGAGSTLIGPWKGTTRTDANGMATVLEVAGFRTMVMSKIATGLWSKALLNACFNPITGILGLRSGALAKSEHLMRCAEMIVEEALLVATAEGVTLTKEDVLESVGGVSRATAQNKSSMLQDLERGGRTEIDFMNGRFAKLGAKHGIPCPVNEMLTLLVKEAEGRGAAGK